MLHGSGGSSGGEPERLPQDDPAEGDTQTHGAVHEEQTRQVPAPV